MVTFPPIAAAYVALFARKRWKAVFPASPLLMRLATILTSVSLLVWLVAAFRRQQHFCR